jgi:hypothetical protein
MLRVQDTHMFTFLPYCHPYGISPLAVIAGLTRNLHANLLRIRRNDGMVEECRRAWRLRVKPAMTITAGKRSVACEQQPVAVFAHGAQASFGV